MRPEAYGVVAPRAGGPAWVGVRAGEHVVDLRRLAGRGRLDPALCGPRLDGLLAAGAGAWAEAWGAVGDALAAGEDDALVPRDGLTLRLPFTVRDLVDFSASETHVATAARLLRPGGDPLPPSWPHAPIAYHGRSSTVVVSGTQVRRPVGHRRVDGEVRVGPSRALDVEVELGAVLGGPPTPLGEPVAVGAAEERIFGWVLLNDWSARDLQRFETVPLGPFLGKSFATSISGWVVPAAALAGTRVPAPVRAAEPAAHLRDEAPWALDLELELALRPAGAGEEAVVARMNPRELAWTFPQLIAHLTSNGASVGPGDLVASGTISGTGPAAAGCLLELTEDGRRPLAVAGRRRAYLEDGDEVVLRGASRAGVVLGEVRGAVLPPLGASYSAA